MPETSANGVTMSTQSHVPDLSASETTPLLPKPPGEDDRSITTSTSPPIEQKVDIREVSLQAEASIFFRYSGPLVLTYFLQYAYQIIIVLVAAQLSTEEIAGVSLGTTTSNITGYALFEGMATALDALCSQAYGASRLSEVGLYTIRGTILIHLVGVLPIGMLWLFSGPIINAIVPSSELAEHASSFLRWTLIGVPGYVLFENGKKFMQAQGNFTAGLIVLVICLPINVGLTYVLVMVADMRVAGAALSASVTNLLRPVLLVAYAKYWKPSTLKCWPSGIEIRDGWRQEWKTVIGLAIPGALMTLSEWLCFEILTFCTTYVGTAALAAQTFLATTATFIWHIPFSASIACSTRIGQLVGADMIDSTAKVMKWYAFIFLLAGIFNSLLGTGIVLLMQSSIIHDPEVSRIILEALPYMAFFVIFDASSNWPHSVVRGFGWQSIGAWCTMTINYLYGVPLSVYLELGHPLLGIRGLWIGLGSGLALTTVVEAFVIWLRLRKRLTATAENEDSPTNQR